MTKRVKLKDGKNYFVGKYVITNDDYTIVDDETAKYLESTGRFEVETAKKAPAKKDESKKEDTKK